MPSRHLILLILLIVLIVGLLPHWPYSSGWGLGYYPSGVGTVLLIVLLLVVFGVL